MIAPCSPAKITVQSKDVQRNAAQCAASDSSWQHRFLELLPKIRRHAQIRFRAQAPELRDELVQETIARALLDYLRLVERGKETWPAQLHWPATRLLRFARDDASANRLTRVTSVQNIADHATV